MLIDVEVLSLIKYEDKDNTGQYKTRISYRLLDPKSISNTANLRGYSDLAYFLDGTELFDKFDIRYFGTSLKFEIEEKSYANNPFKKFVSLKSIKDSNGKDLYIL